MAPGWAAHKSSGCGRNTGGPEQQSSSFETAGSLTTPEMRPLHRAVLMGAGAEGTPAQSAADPPPTNLLRAMGETVQERWSGRQGEGMLWNRAEVST